MNFPKENNPKSDLKCCQPFTEKHQIYILYFYKKEFL